MSTLQKVRQASPAPVRCCHHHLPACHVAYPYAVNNIKYFVPLPFSTSSVTSGKCLYFSEPPCSHARHGAWKFPFPKHRELFSSRMLPLVLEHTCEVPSTPAAWIPATSSPVPALNSGPGNRAEHLPENAMEVCP